MTSNLPLVVRGPHGFGRVTLIALDVDQKPFADWPDRSLFWVRAIDLQTPAQSTRPAPAPASGGGPRFYQSGVSDLSSQLRVALEQFPGVKLIPFGWVAFFIFLYILLIGPGDYFFLKKVLKRMELTWITFPTIVVTVSLVAYYAAYVLKGNDLLVNKVDVVDIDQPAGLARGNTWISLFSPQNRDYTIRTIPMPLDRDAAAAAVRPAAGEPAAAPPAGTEVVTTWFSVARRPVRRHGKLRPPVQLRRRRLCLQPTGGRRVAGECPHPDLEHEVHHVALVRSGRPAGRLRLAARGTDRLDGTVTNRQAVPLEDAILAFGKQVYLLGTLAPGATVRVELTQRPQPVRAT